MAEEVLGLAQAVVQGLPAGLRFQLAVIALDNAHVADLVQGARHRDGRGGLAGADAEHAVFQARAVAVVDQRHAAFRVGGVGVLGLPLRQVVLALLVEQVQVGVPVLGIAQGGFGVEVLLDAVLQLRVHACTSCSFRALRSRPWRRNRCQLACWFT
ncbi:hypothetical protein D3C85_1288660 [compost metagenome]